MYCYYQLFGNDVPMRCCKKCVPKKENKKCKWYYPLNAFEKKHHEPKEKKENEIGVLKN